MWDSVNQFSSQLPNVISLLQGHTSLSKMSWTDINGIVKSVLGEIDDMSQDLGEMKGEFENHALSFIGVTVSLALFTVLALILLCLLALRTRRKLPSPEVTPSLFRALKALEETYKNSTGSEKCL